MAFPTRPLTFALLVMLAVLALGDARRPRPPRRPAAVYEHPGGGGGSGGGGSPYAPYSDQHAAASGHAHHGRVQIKVYRGPDHGHHGHAPHGYWVKQPADDAPHHHRR